MSKLLGINLLFFFSAMNMALGCDSPCLVYAAEERINKLELTTNNYNFVSAKNLQPVAVDIDIKRKRVYWSDFQKRSISRAFLNGTGAETIITNCGAVGGLAVDWLSDHLYWTNSNHKRIGVSNLDGTHRSFIISTNLNEPIGLAIDPDERLIFWSDIGNVPKIEKATLAGNDRQLLVAKNILNPHSLTIDYGTNPKRLFWTDVLEYAVQSIKLDGSDRKNIIKLDKVNIRHPFGITINNNNLYVTDWITGSINVINKGNGIFSEALTTPVTGRIKAIMGIAMFDKSRQPPGSNPCTANNGGCSHLCLAERHGPKCSCPDGVKLNSDGKTCSKLEAFLLIADSYFSLICTIPLDSTTQIVQPVIHKARHSIKQPVAVDYDEKEDKIYWSDTKLKTITRAFLNGSDFQILHHVEMVEGLAIDSESRMIYWTDLSKSAIESSKLDGTSHKVLIDSSYSTKPRGIWASSIDSFIYWTELERNPKLQRAAKDGSSRTVLIDLPSSASPNSLALHRSTYTIYYSDSELHQIVSYDLQTKEKKILNKQSIGYYRLSKYMNQPFGLTMDYKYLYWTDWETQAVYGAKRETGEELKILAEYLGKPTGIKANFGQNPSSSSAKMSCPRDYVIYNKNKDAFDKHEVELPTVKGVIFEKPTKECSPSEISIKDYGEHKITCTARFINGNSVSCSYRIRVKDHLCSRLSPPLNGQVKCTTYCTVTCDEDFVLAKDVTKNMACYGARWRPKEDKNINLFPVCLAKTSPTGIKITSKIAFKKACDEKTDAFVVDAIVDFKNKLTKILNEAKHLLAIFNIKNVSLNCSQEKYQLTKGVREVIEIHFTLFLDSQVSQVDSAFTNPAHIVQTTKNILFKKVKGGSFTLEVLRNPMEAFQDSFKGEESATCSSHQSTKSYYCLKCSFGMYFNKTTQNCEPCAMGTYQDKEGRTKCRDCSDGTSTVVMGTETKLGCYGRKEILANISVGVTKLQIEKFKDVVVRFVNQHCVANKCPIESEENIKSEDAITEKLYIYHNDVVVPLGYPKSNSEKSKLYVAFFVVVSFKDDKPIFLPRAKLHEIFLDNIELLGKQLGGEVGVNPGAQKQESKGSRSSKTNMILLGIAFVVFCIFYL